MNEYIEALVEIATTLVNGLLKEITEKNNGGCSGTRIRKMKANCI